MVVGNRISGKKKRKKRCGDDENFSILEASGILF
jgi:hypothetical protein